jgi:hypothetical protein
MVNPGTIDYDSAQVRVTLSLHMSTTLPTQTGLPVAQQFTRVVQA